MRVLDDEGNLFGRVNVIDALAVLFVLAIVVAGVALVSGGDDPTTTYEITVRTTVPDWHADAFEVGPVSSESNVEAVVAVERVATYEAGFNVTRPNAPKQFVRVDVTLRVVDGEYRVGQSVRFNLERVVLKGAVVRVEAVENPN